jgi:hypothetical protein
MWALFGGFDGDLGKRGNIILRPDGDIINGSATRSTVADVARPPRVVSSTRRRERGGVQRRMWRGPRSLCYRGGDCEAACMRFEFSGFTLSDGV